MEKTVEAKDYFTDAAIEAASKVMCKSGRFETGEGTCAAICMEALGDARLDCYHCRDVHGHLVLEILTAALNAQTIPS